MFSGLSSLVIEGAVDQDEVIVVRARTPGGPVPCPRCGAVTSQVHGYYGRTVADVPADGRPVEVLVRVRRMRCPVLDCPVQTFGEQVPGLLGRYQRRTVRLAGQAGEVTRSIFGLIMEGTDGLRVHVRLPITAEIYARIKESMGPSTRRA